MSRQELRTISFRHGVPLPTFFGDLTEADRDLRWPEIRHRYTVQQWLFIWHWLSFLDYSVIAAALWR